MAILRNAALVVALCLSLAPAHDATQPEPIPQQTCPPCRQSLEAFGKALHVTHQGQRVYVCCAGCATKMQIDWEGYLRVMAALGERPETVEADKNDEGSDKPVIFDPEGRGVCEACMGGACELPEHKPAQSGTAPGRSVR